MKNHIYVDQNGYWHIECGENHTEIPPRVAALLFDKMVDDQLWMEVMLRIDSWSIQEIYDEFSCSREEIIEAKDLIVEHLRNFTSYDLSEDDVCAAIASCV
ncbi:hypothetical protein [Flavonifractor sp. An82]|uniref:hypothetical protein n=1 Tax=Flavonifractor sp. An82 TaxID=1965660 RepID=UPI00112199C9|nr:hypothetical protein [Flavonifractor sp. An82]